jgi:2-(3-amino-3-carboxypropyl)histidine synthase
MKTLFIPAKINAELNKKKILEISKKLPKEIEIAYSIQYKEIASEVKSILSKNHKINSFTQVLGCSSLKQKKQTQAILLISSGKFHAYSLALETKTPVFLLDSNKLIKISKLDIQELEKRKKVSYLKFLNADRVGILVSTKPGQENLQRAIDFKKSVKEKKLYLFLSNELNKSEFENFPINSWVNTACPRLDMDSSIINIGRIL